VVGFIFECLDADPLKAKEIGGNIPEKLEASFKWWVHGPHFMLEITWGWFLQCILRMPDTLRIGVLPIHGTIIGDLSEFSF